MLVKKSIIILDEEVIKKLKLTSPLEIVEGTPGFYLKSTRQHPHYQEYIVYGFFYRNGDKEKTLDFPGIKKVLVNSSKNDSYEITFDDGTSRIIS